MDPILLQAGVTVPFIFFLALYTSLRRNDPVGRDLSLLLWLVLAWVVGMVVQPTANSDGSLDAWVGLLVFPPAVFMAPVFLLMMLQYARVEAFTDRRGSRWAVLAPFVLFYLGFATNDWHGLMMRPGTSLDRAASLQNARSLFWAFQIWSNGAALAGLAICAQVAYRDRSGDERRRMSIVVVSGLIPLAAHWSDTIGLLPIDYPITPAALAVTCLFMTVAVRQYRLLDIQPVARRDVIEASEDAVVIGDASGRIVDCNPATARLLDEPRSALLGVSLDSLAQRMDPNQTCDEIERFFEALIERIEPSRCEFEISDGRFIEASASPVRQRGGVVAGNIVVLRDRSQERRAQHRLQHSQKLESVGILAAGVAHEVNNPLAFVRANLAHIRQSSELIEEHAPLLPEKVRDELEDLVSVVDESLDGLDRIQNIVRGLLQFSARPSEKQTPTNVNEAIIVASRFASFGGSSRCDERLGVALPKTSLPHDQLIQVFLNLLLNARNAIKDEPQGVVTVTSRLNGDEIEVRVEDNGPGVPDEIRERIFDLFFTTSGPDQGTGLGLSIAHEILRENEASLELDREYREGAAFVVRLPVVTG
jgi:PAS domain S-box-containing protein